ncbi:MAG: CSLREA domain-containing protein [Acidobacteriota bacterium]|nr:CSLREA domain-containing protein [Acidobacteriota bacterium]
MKTKEFGFLLLTVLCGIILAAPTSILAQTCTPPPSGMVAWFPGDGNANDIQGNNNGTINGGVTFTAGKVAQAFTFDGTGDVTYSTINAGSAYTLDFWMRPTLSGVNQHIISNFANSTNFGSLRFVNDHVEYLQGGAFQVVSAAGSVPLNAYTHIALTYDGSVNRLYTNGSLAATSGVHTETFNNQLSLGFAIINNYNESRFSGQIDEVEIFSRALSQTEIQAIVTADSAGKCKPPVTFIVNTTSDTNDGACDATHCSLREAIIASNASAGVKDNINFNIPGAGVQTINVGSSGLGGLPPITDAVNINGYSQPGSAVNTVTVGSTNAVPLIELNGQSAGVFHGLLLSMGSGGSAIRGLIINRFANSGSTGLVITTSNIFVGGCFIGTDSTGTKELPNTNGVIIMGIDGTVINGNRIGSPAPAERNLISGNSSSGIRIRPNNTGGTGTLNDTELSGNLIGINAQGTAALPNEIGVDFGSIGGFSVTDLRIGMPGESGGNIISGNRSDGILFNGTNAVVLSGVAIRNNRIGTNGQGTGAIPNGSNPSTSSTGRSGIYLFPLANNVQIGGANASEGNLISGNFNHGIYVRASDNVIIQGNRIGTDASGTSAIGNTDGVNIDSSRNNIVGGTTTGARNLISGNNDDGVSITGSRSSGNVVQGNFIGTDISGTAGLSNIDMGVSIGGSALNNIIGDTAGSAGNLIAFNGVSGVFVATDSTRNSILANSIFSNTGLGIDLFPSGVTPNDAGDADTGANNLQNYPVLTAAMSSGNIQGTFNSTPNTQFRIEFFSNQACDPSGFGEGQTFIGFQNVTTDSSGNATVNFTSSAALGAGQFITSTATDPNNNTSEFSACRQISGTTAASVSISGRVMSINGRGISNVRVMLTDSAGESRIVVSNAFGYYRFTDVSAGGTYIISATDKRYIFANPTQALLISEETNGINFTAAP